MPKTRSRSRSYSPPKYNKKYKYNIPSQNEIKNNYTICNENDLHINDIIYVEFSCLSQKFILTPKFGKIIKLDTNNMINTEILNYYDEIESFMHPYVSYYGDTPGYWFTIYKKK